MGHRQPGELYTKSFLSPLGSSGSAAATDGRFLKGKGPRRQQAAARCSRTKTLFSGDPVQGNLSACGLAALAPTTLVPQADPYGGPWGSLRGDKPPPFGGFPVPRLLPRWRAGGTGRSSRRTLGAATLKGRTRPSRSGAFRGHAEGTVVRSSPGDAVDCTRLGPAWVVSAQPRSPHSVGVKRNRRSTCWLWTGAAVAEAGEAIER
ncbi:uncharacterized protein M6G45_015875 isoform 1-T1 [Spheniscus humboldti]